MGQSKGGGYTKKDTFTPEQTSFLQQLLSQSQGNTGAAEQGFKSFLSNGAGGQGGHAITDQANKNFQQQTLPAITNAFGSGAKTSSALNQALAAGGANLNTDIASMIAQMQLGASQGLAGIGSNQAQLGSQPQFAYLQRQMPFWQSALLGTLNSGSQLAGQALGRPGAQFGQGFGQ